MPGLLVVKHVFKDGRYVEQSRTPADLVPVGAAVLSEEFDFADGVVLEPGE